MSKILQEQICGWPGFRLTSGDVSLGVAPGIGGRIVSLAFRGEELLFVLEEEKGRVYDLSQVKDLPAFKREFGFRFFGGDKTWVAPENDWTGKIPPLDLDAGPYSAEQKDGGLVLVSPVCRETGLQVTRRISLADNGTITLREELFNATTKVLKKGIWNVTQVKRPFHVFLPAKASDVRSYFLEDPTLPRHDIVLEERDGWSVVPCRSDICYKFGALLKEGKAILMKDTPAGRIFWNRTFSISQTAPYAHRSMVEVFNSSRYDYGEMEVHSPLFDIPPGQSVFFEQKWRLGIF